MHSILALSVALGSIVVSAAPTPNGGGGSSKCSPTGISGAAAALVVDQFRLDQIAPDLIERIYPTVQITAVYNTGITTGSPDGSTLKAVNLGTYFAPTETLNAPKFSFSAESSYDPYKTKYSYFLVDPDVPQDGSMVQVNYLHWQVAHAQPSCVTSQSPQTIAAYQAPSPASTTQHRYTFLVYREPAGYSPDVIDAQLRTPYDLNDYTQANGLVLVGGKFFKESIVNRPEGGITALPPGVTLP